ncbi:hypothetical protein M0R89_09135 [Halorussus limi]|uniref:Uncharacterized protein n=1 Tax=Halorussus limi TaxID=2938695 RepID=A0A8U0HZ44_9EURY|nr:hypothetical protein [Halorussus limi]UPV76198.1 hypothetical protein M0R89_09135 [Halorussus limi]
MTKNKFFLREEYTQQEKENRIRAEEFTVDNPPVLNILSGTRLTPDDVHDMGREEFLNIIREDISKERYDEFIDKMFEDYGRDGDRFNQQLFFIPPSADLDGLGDSLSKFTDGPLEKPFDFILTQPLYLNEIDIKENTIDLRFNTATHIEEYESDEEIPITVMDEDGNLVQKIPEDQKVSIPTKRRVEARIYKNERIISVSNSEVPSRLQTEIFNIILAVINDSPEIKDSEEVDDD